MWFSIADGGLLVSLLVALLLFRETPFLGSPTRSLASEFGLWRLAECGLLESDAKCTFQPPWALCSALGSRPGDPAETDRPVVLCSFASLAAESVLDESLAGVGEGRADSDLLVIFLTPFNGAVRGREERGFIGDEDFRRFSFSFSSLFIDLGVEMASAKAERDSRRAACS